MKCANCGFELEDDARFCPECGSKIEAAAVEEVKEETPAEAVEEVKEETPAEAVAEEVKEETPAEAVEEAKEETPAEEAKVEAPVDEPTPNEPVKEEAPAVETVKEEAPAVETVKAEELPPVQQEDNPYAYIPDDTIESVSYTEPNYNPEEAPAGKNAWACFVGFGCGIGCIFCNPCSITLICAIVFSIIGLCGKSDKKTFAIIGLCLAGLGLIVQAVIDILSGGIGLIV